MLFRSPRVFDAMMDAGTPCPYDGMIGDAAKAAWIADSDRVPEDPQSNIIKDLDDEQKSTLLGGGFVGGLLLLLLL